MENEEIIKETVQALMEKMGFPADIEMQKIEEDGKEVVICNIKTQESNFLIGQYGVNLQSLQHIARLLVKKKSEDRIDFILDVNAYRQEKNNSIIKLAQEMAQQALSEGRAVVLRPMSPYERRLIHIELLKNSRVKTESIGDGEDRKVVIKPADSI